MIKKLIKEYREGNFAILTEEVTFFNIPIFKCKKISTNNTVVRALTPIQQNKGIKIKGFKYETNNKSKKNSKH